MWQEIKISLRELIVAIQMLLMQIGHNRPVVCITLDSDHMILVMSGDYFGFLVRWPKCCAAPADIPCLCDTWCFKEEYKRGTTS